MVKSMTGFGRSEKEDGLRKCSVEIKSVNHRYLELGIKMPKKLNFFDTSIRNLLKTYIGRGKVDIFITYEDKSEENVTIKYNSSVAKEYLDYLKKMQEEFGLECEDIRASSLSRYPEVFTLEEGGIDEEEIWAFLESAIKEACENFTESRIKEGENLKNDMIDKLDGMLKNVDFITDRSPIIVEEYKKKLTDKVKDLLEDNKIDEGRILAEVVIYADKVCVDEELVRLRSHIAATRDELLKGGAVGRKLDFIAQEMNREANTTLSKSTDLEISNAAIELKTDIEKIREQIQNIE